MLHFDILLIHTLLSFVFGMHYFVYACSYSECLLSLTPGSVFAFLWVTWMRVWYWLIHLRDPTSIEFPISCDLSICFCGRVGIKTVTHRPLITCHVTEQAYHWFKMLKTKNMLSEAVEVDEWATFKCYLNRDINRGGILRDATCRQLCGVNWPCRCHSNVGWRAMKI